MYLCDCFKAAILIVISITLNQPYVFCSNETLASLEFSVIHAQNKTAVKDDQDDYSSYFCLIDVVGNNSAHHEVSDIYSSIYVYNCIFPLYRMRNICLLMIA